MGVLDVRATIETNDGALIYLSYYGLSDVGEDSYDKLVKGESPPNELDIRNCPKLITAHPNYLWVNRVLCVGAGRVFFDRLEVVYDVYVVR
jgi:hypothetical protein